MHDNITRADNPESLPLEDRLLAAAGIIYQEYPEEALFATFTSLTVLCGIGMAFSGIRLKNKHKKCA